MANDLTIRDLQNDMDRLRRSNNWGNAMISAGVDRINRNLVGSSIMLYSQLGEISCENSRAFDSITSSVDDLQYEIQSLRKDARSVAEKVASSIKEAEKMITSQIRLSASKLQLSIDNVQDAVNRVNKQIQELVQENKVQTSILSHINEGIHNPEIQKTNNGIEDYSLRNYESAVQSFNAALAFRLSLYLPHYYLGLIYSDKNDDNNVYDISKAEKEIKDAIFYGMKLVSGNDDVLSYMLLAHRAYANILRQEGQYPEAIEQLNKGVDLTKENFETRVMYVEEYVKCYNSMGEKDKALIFARFGLENDASYVSLLVDEDLEDLRSELLTIIDELNVSFSEIIGELVEDSDDYGLLAKINKLISAEDAKTFLGRSKIINMIKRGKKDVR